MKIAQVAPYFYPHIGGVESHVHTLSKHLLSKHHDVTVVTSIFPGLKNKAVVDGIKVERVRSLFTLLRTPITTGLGDALDGFDVVHAHTPPPLISFFAARACRRNNIPLALTYHCDPEIPTPFGMLIVSLYRRTFGRYTLAHTDRLIVTTNSYAATSRGVWRHELCVVPNAVDVDTFNPNVDGSAVREEYGLEGEIVVLFVGRIVPHKGIEYVIGSSNSTDAKYLIVGDGPLREKLERTVAQRGLQNVVFTGKVPNARLPEYYAAGDIFVLPSIARLEAFGIVALEAMATGKPVIITNIPGVREIITDGIEGLVVEPMNAEALAAQINKLADDKGLRLTMGANSRKNTVERFSWSKIVNDIEHIYKEMIE